MALLRALAARYPTADLALAEASALRASLTLPTGVVHVISDVHGEYKKLRHIINNASGSLRPLVETLFGAEMDEKEIEQLLSVIYYPHESVEYLRPTLVDPARRSEWVRRTLRRQFRLARSLASTRRFEEVRRLLPDTRRELFEELLFEPCTGRGTSYLDVMIDTLTAHDRDFSAVRAASRLVRNLSVAEIVVAGDLGDRGPRIDRVIDYIMRQPRVAISWGNHDVSWMGACLGHEALMPLCSASRCATGAARNSKRVRHHPRAARKTRADCLRGRPGGMLQGARERAARRPSVGEDAEGRSDSSVQA